jgi:predicted DNA-binding transcriptional regulator AlpA
MNTTNEWLTASEAALEVRVSRATLYRYWSLGNGPRYSQLGARRLVRRAWLTGWLLEKEAA